MKNTLCALLLVSAISAHAETFEAKNRWGQVVAQFEKIQLSDGIYWKDSSGHIWSDVVGQHENVDRNFEGGFTPDLKIKNSAATDACKSIGGRLPNYNELESLLNTDIVFSDYKKLFPKLKDGHAIWTSRQFGGDHGVTGLTLSTTLPNVPGLTSLSYKNDVICIINP